MNKLFLLLATLSLISEASAESIPTVAPLTTTQGSYFTEDMRDDPAIWVHPSDSSQSLILGSDKRDQGGGLHVYDLQGKELQYLEGGKLNNVDIIPGLFQDGDLALASDRNAKSIKFYKINGSGQLAPLTTNISIAGEPYGLCGGMSDGKAYAFVTTKAGPVEQWELTPSSPTIISGKKVRTLPRTTQCEGCVLDREGQYVYIGEEDAKVLRYQVDPSTQNNHRVVDEVGPHLTADIEGITLYSHGGQNYLIVSSQGDSTFAVYDLNKNNSYVGSFKIAGVAETDGITVTPFPLGEDYPQGLFVAHNHRLSNFAYVPWDRVEKALGL